MGKQRGHPMDFTDWAEKLRELGFNRTEAMVYLALLGEPSLSAGKLVRKSGVPRPKVYDAARSLIAQGFAEEIVGDVKTFRAIPPERAVPTYKRRTEEKLARDTQLLGALSKAVPEAVPLPVDGWDVRILYGAANVYHAIRDLESEATEVIRLIGAPFFYLSRPTRLAARYGDKVKFFGLVETASLQDAEKGAEVRTMALEDSRFRFTDRLPARAVIIDRKTAVMALRADTDGPTLIIPDCTMVRRMAEWAVAEWERARPISELNKLAARAKLKEDS